MATTKVVDILDRASIILQDNTNVRFPNDELKFFNGAQKEVVLHRPDAKMVNESFSCANGSKQNPAAALRLIEIVRNVGGRAVTQVDRKILDETLPNWHETAAEQTRSSISSTIQLTPSVSMYIQRLFRAHTLSRLCTAQHLLMCLSATLLPTLRPSLWMTCTRTAYWITYSIVHTRRTLSTQVTQSEA